jgi:hypothetical protein
VCDLEAIGAAIYVIVNTQLRSSMFILHLDANPVNRATGHLSHVPC